MFTPKLPIRFYCWIALLVVVSGLGAGFLWAQEFSIGVEAGGPGDPDQTLPAPQATPNPAVVGEWTATPVFARVLPSTSQDYSPEPINGPTWSWQIAKVQYSSDGVTWSDVSAEDYAGKIYPDHPDDSVASATIRAALDSAGSWKITAKATVAFDNSPGPDTWTGSATTHVVIKVVEPGFTFVSAQSSICAGGQNDTTDRTSVTALVTNPDGSPKSGVQVTLTSTEGTLTAPWVITGSDGRGSAYLYSSSTAFKSGVSAAPFGLATVTGSIADPSQSATLNVTFGAPTTTILANPNNTIPNQQASVVFQIKWHGQPVPGHAVSWRISAVWDSEGNPVTDPGQYADYGSLVSGGTSDSSGISQATFTGGQKSGKVEIAAADTTWMFAGAVACQEEKDKVKNKGKEKVNLNIDGVDGEKKKTPGGYVIVNGNKDHKPDQDNIDNWNPIPKKRDKDFVGKIENEKDLVKIKLEVNGTGAATERAVLSVTQAAPSVIKIWEKATRENEVALPKEWKVADMPKELYVEGIHEGKEMRQIKITLELKDNPKVLGTDFVQFTVTPVLTEIKVTKNYTPDYTVWKSHQILDSAGGNDFETKPTFRLSATAIVGKKTNGKLRLVQAARNINNMDEGKVGCKVNGADKMRWDWTQAEMAKKYVVDAWNYDEYPYYGKKEKQTTDGDKMTVIADDSPGVYLNNVRLGKILPDKDKKTKVDVTLDFILHAVWEYDDKSLYYLGVIKLKDERGYYARFSGDLKNVDGKYSFDGDENNKNVGFDNGFEINNDMPDYAKARDEGSLAPPIPLNAISRWHAVPK